MAYEFWKNAVRTTHGVFAMYELCENRGSLCHDSGVRNLYCDDSFDVDLTNTVYALDATTMPVAVSMDTIFSHQ